MAYLILENSDQRTALKPGGYYDFNPDCRCSVENIKQILLSRNRGSQNSGLPVNLLTVSSNDAVTGKKVTGFIKNLLQGFSRKRTTDCCSEFSEQFSLCSIKPSYNRITRRRSDLSVA